MMDQTKLFTLRTAYLYAMVMTNHPKRLRECLSLEMLIQILSIRIQWSKNKKTLRKLTSLLRMMIKTNRA